MKLYCGIDLHSNNSVITIINEEDDIILQKRVPNDLSIVLKYLTVHKKQLFGVAVESTFNWYWLVDGLQSEGYSCHLVNTTALTQYSGLKRTDDNYDAFWLAHLMRLNILPTGYIYPKETRSLRDLLRKRTQLVRCRTSHILSLQNQIWRNSGEKMSASDIKQIKEDFFHDKDPLINMALNSNKSIIEACAAQIDLIEKIITSKIKPQKNYHNLLTVNGIGKILAFTILLETGDIHRFKKVGHYASYCRCVDSCKSSNGKKKGVGNKKNGNKYLSWAFVEAAHYAKRYNEKAAQFYQKKAAKVNTALATKALAHKLSRACYYILKDGGTFNEQKLFA